MEFNFETEEAKKAMVKTFEYSPLDKSPQIYILASTFVERLEVYIQEVKERQEVVEEYTAINFTF